MREFNTMFGKHVGSKLSAYLHGELPAEEVRRVAEHLRDCTACRAEQEEISFGAQMAAQLAREQAPESVWNELELALNGNPVHRRGAKEAKATRRKSWMAIPAFQFAAVAIALSLMGAAFWLYRRESPPEADNRPSWEVTRLNGQPVIGKKKMDEKGRLPVGEWLATDDASRAQISVGQIGEVKIEPNSRVRLVTANGDEHRLAMTRGKMEAFIWAPPRQFFVETPSALAVDLGCSYTLEVNDDGVGLLHVTLGWVAFESQALESFVPAGAMCVTRPKLGPGTPYFNDASEKLREALARFDTSSSADLGNMTPREIGLTVVLAEARKRDALTLWHLLARTVESERGRVYDRLAELIPPPPNVTREGVLNGDRKMLDAWWDKLELGDTEWWRMWKGPLPTQK
jgi:hypothetical protein